MKNAELLNEVFRFKHKRPSDCQDASLCVTLAKWFATFVRKLEAVEDPDVQCGRLEPLADDRVVSAAVFSVHEVELLEKVAQRLTAPSERHERGDVWFGPWLPQYGCVLQRSQLNATTVQIEVVFVDGWERTLHFLPSGECVHSAISTTHHAVHCVDLEIDLEARFSTTFTSKLREAQSFKGNQRSAVRNQVGHQKTPQFIAAIVRKTVTSVLEKVAGYDTVSTAPRGGTTDVGLHTGGRARDTCWPVVQAAIARNLCCEAGLFRKLMVAMKMSALQMAVSDVERNIGHISVNEGCADVDDLFYMLEVIIQSIVELLECGYDVVLVEDKCATLRSSIEGFVDVLNAQNAENYVMPDYKELEKVSKLRCGISASLPKRRKAFNSGESKEQRHQRAFQNLEGCSVLKGNSCTFHEVLQWSNSTNPPASYKLILLLRTFETHMFERALHLNDASVYRQVKKVEDVQTVVTRFTNKL